jgi:hypothetical protein
VFLLIPVFAAAVFPPTITKSFSPPIVGVNELSKVTITITNPNSTALTGASMNDSFGGGLFTNGTASTTCTPGSVFASPTLLNLASATIPANGSCTVTTFAFSSTPGLYQNLTGAVFSSGPASLGGASATLNVSATIPAMSRTMLVILALMLAAVGWTTSSSRSS